MAPTDVVLLLVGPAGSGKSSFIQNAGYMQAVEIGDGIKPCKAAFSGLPHLFLVLG